MRTITDMDSPNYVSDGYYDGNTTETRNHDLPDRNRHYIVDFQWEGLLCSAGFQILHVIKFAQFHTTLAIPYPLPVDQTIKALIAPSSVGKSVHSTSHPVQPRTKCLILPYRVFFSLNRVV